MILCSLFLTLQIQDQPAPQLWCPHPALFRASLHWYWVMQWCWSAGQQTCLKAQLGLHWGEGFSAPDLQPGTESGMHSLNYLLTTSFKWMSRGCLHRYLMQQLLEYYCLPFQTWNWPASLIHFPGGVIRECWLKVTPLSPYFCFPFQSKHT